jgi:hypothetical protein
MQICYDSIPHKTPQTEVFFLEWLPIFKYKGDLFEHYEWNHFPFGTISIFKFHLEKHNEQNSRKHHYSVLKWLTQSRIIWLSLAIENSSIARRRHCCLADAKCVGTLIQDWAAKSVRNKGWAIIVNFSRRITTVFLAPWESVLWVSTNPLVFQQICN